MGCNCKNGPSINEMLKTENENKETISFGKQLITYSFKTIVFLMLLVTLPLIMLYIIWIMFKTLMLNKDIDIKPLLMSIANKFKLEDEEIDADIDYLSVDDYVLMDVEDITPKRLT